ncbi:hypothetical protein LCGC14_0691360 [marine sediment metagenome]|uniref:Uncharacterized protein n=1 Tax=marine sediment metagenome TaxID=412755 RepID=A0A0F9TT94_9ZZZZ
MTDFINKQEGIRKIEVTERNANWYVNYDIEVSPLLGDDTLDVDGVQKKPYAICVEPDDARRFVLVLDREEMLELLEKIEAALSFGEDEL